MKEIIDTLDFIKIKSICSAKDNIKRMEDEPQTGKKYDKRLSLKTYKKTLKTQQ